MTLTLDPKKILMILISIIVILLMANILGVILKVHFNIHPHNGFVRLFDFATEKNIPTFFSAILLFFTSILLIVITFIHKKTSNDPTTLWSLLAAIFLFLSIDEISSIHERFVDPVRNFLGATGIFYYAWIIPYGLALIVLFILYFKFLLKLPKKILVLFLLSGSLFVLGAIGFEMLEGWHDYAKIDNDLIYAVYYTCEELLEMLGVTIFIYALLEYIVIKLNKFTILLTSTH